jgi:hypothetical protein
MLIAADVAIALIVGDDEDDIGAGSRRRKRRKHGLETGSPGQAHMIADVKFRQPGN